MLALLVAACFALAWVLRLGWIADYFSRPVLLGYIHGVAVVLIIGQLGKLLGLSIDARDPLSQLWEVLHDLNDISGTTVVLAAAALAALFALRALHAEGARGALVVVAAIALSWAFDLQAHGVAVVGAIPAGLPSFAVPRPAWQDVIQLLPAAVGVFLVSFADEILTARSFAGKHNQHVRAPQELLAMGTANAAAGFTQGFSIGASGSRTAVNDSMGARSQVAGLVAAAAVLAIVVFLTEPVQYLPKAVLGAVIVFAAIGLFEPTAWRALAAVDHVEVSIAAVTTGCVIVLGVLEALIVAVGLSMIDTVRRSASPHDAVLGWVERLGRYADVSLHPSARVTPGIIVYRLDDRLFFANVRYFKGRVREAIRAAPAPVAWLVFDAEAVTHVDSTGLDALDNWCRSSALRRSRSSSPASGHAWRSCSQLQASPRRSDANGSTPRSAWPSTSASRPPRGPRRPRADRTTKRRRAGLRCDVLVQVEEVVGIVGPLDLDQAVVVLAVVVSNLGRSRRPA